MHEEQRRRAADLLNARGVDGALFAHNDSLKWLTGVARPIELDLYHMAGGPPAMWYERGRLAQGDQGVWTLIVPDAFMGDITCAAALRAFAAEPGCRVLTYTTYTIETPIQSGENLRRLLMPLARSAAGRLGFEMQHVSADMLSAFQDAKPGASYTRLDGWLVPLRAVKTDDEIARLRANFRLADAAQQAARAAVREGAREIDVFTAAQAAASQLAGRRVPMGNDFVANTRDFNIGGWGGDLALGAHGSIMIDISTGHDGYWSDSCATCYVDPTPQQQAMWRLALDALAYGITLIRPGAVAREIDAAVRAFVAKAGYPVYPHHTGHGLGVSVHEEPRIVPYSDAVLEPGMVIVLEPGTYIPGREAARAEVGLLVTRDGAEILSHHLDDWLA